MMLTALVLSMTNKLLNLNS